ncbi:MAG: hypothetical protein JSS32_09530 [Verrucomicrobia bacterium]|nr:hypothetical protein [Verrucomicrobiota bacterium]
MKQLFSIVPFVVAMNLCADPLTPSDRANIEAFGAIQKTEAPKKPKVLHDSTYRAEVDIDFSPYAGGESILFANRAAERIERFFLDTAPIQNSKSVYACLARVSELVSMWIPLNYLATVVQHEVFGHGYRIRDIGHGRAKVKTYHFGTPPPYGSGGGTTIYKVGDKLTTTQENTIASAGVESTAILGNLTKFKWLESGFVDPKQSVLYLLCQQDITLYIGSLRAIGDGDLSGHDIHDYIQSLNWTYTNTKLTSGRLMGLTWINWIDPFTYYAAYSWFRYIASGKETKMPMIPLFGAKYLPGLRMGLTPFGPEFFVENYLAIGRDVFYFYGKGGSHSDNDYWGLGFYAPKIFSISRWRFGLRFDGWRQPKLLLQPGSLLIEEINFNGEPNPDDPIYPYSEQHEMKMGCAASLIVYLRGSPRYGFETELGYKTIGFLPGYALRASPVARLAFALVF